MFVLCASSVQEGRDIGGDSCNLGFVVFLIKLAGATSVIWKKWERKIDFSKDMLGTAL